MVEPAEKLTEALAKDSVVLVERISWVQGKAAWHEEGMQVYRPVGLDSLQSNKSFLKPQNAPWSKVKVKISA